MKLNYRMFKSVQGEPLEVQEINGAKVSLYDLTETPYFTQFVMKGRFSVWTSDGKDYKVLVEKGYKEASGDFYNANVNAVWMDFFDKAGAVNNRALKFILLPVVLFFVVIVILSSVIKPLQAYQNYALIVGILGLLVASVVQSRFVRKKFDVLSRDAQQKIAHILTEKGVDTIADAQQAYIESYFENLQKEGLEDLPVEEENNETTSEEESKDE